MDETLIIDTIESVRGHLEAHLPDYGRWLERCMVADYRHDRADRLQEVLAQVTYNLRPWVAADAREIQRRLARAEAFELTATRGGGRLFAGQEGSWVVQDRPQVINDERDEQFAQAVRYLGVAPEGDSAGPPTRFGAELLACDNHRAALSLVRRRFGFLKKPERYRFLALIGYEIAVPGADQQRLAGYVGLWDGDDATRRDDSYILMVQHAARLTNYPAAQVSAMLAAYSGGDKVEGFAPVCGREPRCEVCKLSARCSRFNAAATSDGEAGAEGGRPGAATAAAIRRRPINEWSADERPRERLLAGERLTNSELLGVILRTGSGALSAVELGRELLHEFGTLHDLERATPHDIVLRMKGRGIGPAKAVEICAAIELGRRVSQPAADTRLGLRQVSSSRDVFDLCRARYKAATQEEFLLLVLNTRNRIQKEVSISVGTLNSSIVHPRDVFGHALREAAAGVIFVHNHPSGDPSPSEEDITLTRRLVEAGKLLGIKVLDHVVIGSHEWYSFADHGKISGR